MGIELVAGAAAALSAAGQYHRQKFAGNPGHAHEDPILAKRRAAEAADRSREARIAADLATVKRDNRVGLVLITTLVAAFVLLVASCVGPEPAYAHPPHNHPPVHPASGNNTPANPDQDGHVLRGGSH